MMRLAFTFLCVVCGLCGSMWARAADDIPISVDGDVAVGMYVNPIQPEVLPDFRLNLSMQCTGGPVCKQQPLTLFRMKTIFAVDAFSTRVPLNFVSPEYHLPYLTFWVEPIAMRISPKLSLGFLTTEVRRDMRMTKESVNVQHTLARLEVSFGVKESPWVHGGAFVSVGSVGYKHVTYAYDRVIPFSGLMLGDATLGWEYRFGNETLSFGIGGQLRSLVAIGRSGNGDRSSPGQFGLGEFGAVVSEHRVNLYASVRVGLPEVMRHHGVPYVQFVGFFEAGYHMSRGCISGGQASASCGNNTAFLFMRAGATVGVPFGVPPKTPARI